MLHHPVTWLMLAAALWSGCSREPNLSHRPDPQDNVFDYARLLEDIEPYAQKQLDLLEEDYGIEAVIVTIPTLEGAERTEFLAADLLNRWQIGGQNQGRGLLLLFVQQTDTVKLEVAYALEDVFTDAFSGYAANVQLQPRYKTGDMGIGLTAVLEEIEQRARLKHQGDYTPADIAQLDATLTGGAGATVRLATLPGITVTDTGTRYPAAPTPEAAWQTMLQSWRDQVHDPNLGVYTPLTRLAYRDYTQMPDRRLADQYRTYHGKPYQVLTNGTVAAIVFHSKTGWDNAPFLFTHSPEGWQFDMVSQRKYVRMGRNPAWGIERADHPYTTLLSRLPYFTGQDIPLTGEDRHTPAVESQWAEAILKAEQAHRANPDQFNTLLDLGRLYARSALSTKAIPILKKAKALQPDHPLPHKYLAIAYVDSTYQYEAARPEMEAYVQRSPQDPFGHAFLGYLHLQLGDYEQAIERFNQTLQLDPHHAYALEKRAVAYGKRYLKMTKADPRRPLILKQLQTARQQARDILTDEHPRSRWLDQWYRKNFPPA